MPESVETEKVHFFHRLLRGPSVESHAVGCDENAGAVIAKPAVNKYPFFFVREEGEKLRDLFVGGRRPSANGNVDKAHAERFSLFAFPFDEFAIFPAKINDGGDAEFLELFDAFGVRLRAPKERLGDFSPIGKAGEFEFFAVGGAKHRCGSGGGRRLSESGRSRKRNKSQEGQACSGTKHSNCDQFQATARSFGRKVPQMTRGLDNDFTFGAGAPFEREQTREIQQGERGNCGCRFSSKDARSP